MLLSRNRWEAYAGISQKKSFNILKSVLEDQGLCFKVSKVPPHYMYDAKNEQIVIRTNELALSLIYVSADPLTRLFSSLLGTSQKLGGITLLSIRYHKHSKQQFASVIQSFVQNSPKPPWIIRSHPRFQFAVLLQLINKWKWKKAQMV